MRDERGVLFYLFILFKLRFGCNNFVIYMLLNVLAYKFVFFFWEFFS